MSQIDTLDTYCAQMRFQSSLLAQTATVLKQRCAGDPRLGPVAAHLYDLAVDENKRWYKTGGPTNIDIIFKSAEVLDKMAEGRELCISGPAFTLWHRAREMREIVDRYSPIERV